MTDSPGACSALEISGRKNGEKLIMLSLDGRAVPLRIRRNRLARRLILSIDVENDGVALTLPARASINEGLDMAHGERAWILSRLDALPPRVPFAHGSRVPILGRHHMIQHRAEGPHPVWAEDGTVFVTGHPEHLPRRFTDWLRKEARLHIAGRVKEKAARVDRRAGRLTLRDTRTRWGSCSHDGNLSFSWRLVMTPQIVLDYVVAHEVAHLRYRGHGPRFWGLVAKLTGDVDAAHGWLRQHGENLHRYG